MSEEAIDKNIFRPLCPGTGLLDKGKTRDIKDRFSRVLEAVDGGVSAEFLNFLAEIYPSGFEYTAENVVIICLSAYDLGRREGNPKTKIESPRYKKPSVRNGHKSRLYLAGPMTGLPDKNYPVFHAEAQRLRALGYHVENPAEFYHKEDATWEVRLMKDIPRLLTCDIIALLPGWKRSKGARLELHIAKALNIQCVRASKIID